MLNPHSGRMLHRLLIATLSIILVSPFVKSTAQSHPTAEDVLTRFVEAVGDVQGIESVKTIVTEGEIIDWDGQRFPFKSYRKFPDRGLIIEFRNRKEVRRGFDGKIKWVQEGTRKPEYLHATYDAANDVEFRDILHWRDKFTKIDFAGEADLLNRKAYVLKVIGSRPATLYFDQQTSLLLRRDTRWEQKAVHIYYSHYVETSGTKTPWRAQYVYGQEGRTYVRQITKLATNTPLEDEMFAMPTP